MKKIFLFAVVFWVSLVFSLSCYAADTQITKSPRGAYVTYSFGFTMLNDSDVTDSTVPGVTAEVEFDPGYAFGLALGHAMDCGFRFEGEILYHRSKLDKANFNGTSYDADTDIKMTTFMANGYYDFLNRSRFIPFISAGIGFSRVDADISITGSGFPSNSDCDVVFSGQAGLGAAFLVSKTTLIECKYRYLITVNPEFNTTEAEISSHNLYFGVRIHY